MDDFRLKLVSGGDGTSDKQSVLVPIKKLPATMMKEVTTVGGYNRYLTTQAPASSILKVWVGNELWSHAISSLDEYTGGTDKVYVYDTVSGVICFGNGDNSAFPFGSDSITMRFNPERLFPTNKKNNHAAQLEYPTPFSNSRVVVRRYDEDVEALTHVQSGSTRIDLGHTNIVDVSSIATSMTSLGYTTRKVFQNGNSELRISTDWSIDVKNGVIYVKQPIGNDVDAVLSYTYSPVYELTRDDFDFSGEEGIANKIVIRESGWKTVEVEDEEIAAEDDAKSYDLGNLAVVSDTLTISLSGTTPTLSSTNNPFVKEVPYQNGIKEFGKEFLNTRERVPDLTPSANVATFDLVEDISEDTLHAVAFSNNTLFSTEVSGTPADTGEYSVTRSGGNRGRVSVYTTSSVGSAAAGYVSYFYDNPSYQSNGLYSVDYINGRVYMQRAIPSSNDWVISSSYQYTNYKASYRIARLVNPNEYEVNLTERKITFDEAEILAKDEGQQVSDRGNYYYIVNYGRIKAGGSSLVKLKSYYSPVIRHYTLKVRMSEGN